MAPTMAGHLTQQQQLFQILHQHMFQILHGSLQAHIYNRRGHCGRSANAVVTVAAITRALPQSTLRRSHN